MRDILISRKRWKTVRVGGVGARQLGGGRRARFSSAPKRGGTSEEGAEGGRDEGRGGGELHRQINTRYFNGWEMRVCFAACLPGTAKLNFNSENGVQPSIRMETEPRIAYFIIVIYIYIYTVSNIEEGERNKNYREKLFFLGAFLAEEREKKRERKEERGGRKSYISNETCEFSKRGRGGTRRARLVTTVRKAKGIEVGMGGGGAGPGAGHKFKPRIRTGMRN